MIAVCEQTKVSVKTAMNQVAAHVKDETIFPCLVSGALRVAAGERAGELLSLKPALGDLLQAQSESRLLALRPHQH